MSSAAIHLRDVQCGICLQIINDPRALFCMHTFCAECLLNSSTADRRMFCQTCRKETPLFAGIDGLAKDLDMRAKVQRYLSSQSSGGFFSSSPPPPSLNRFDNFAHYQQPYPPATLSFDHSSASSSSPSAPLSQQYSEQPVLSFNDALSEQLLDDSYFLEPHAEVFYQQPPPQQPAPPPPPPPSAAAAAPFPSQQRPQQQQQSATPQALPRRAPPPLPDRELPSKPQTQTPSQPSPSSSSTSSPSSSSVSPPTTSSSSASSSSSSFSSSSSSSSSSNTTTAVSTVTSSLGSMWKALKGESRYPTNDTRTINLKEVGSTDLVTTADQRRAMTSGDIVSDVTTMAISAACGGLIAGLVSGKDEVPPPLLEPKDKRVEEVDLGAGFAQERVKPDEALAKFMKWIKGQWFLPSDLEEKFSTAEMERLFVPFWVFASRTTTSFHTTALVPTEEFMRSGSPLLAKDAKALEDESVPKEWVRIEGSREDVYDRIVIVATDAPHLVKYSKDFEPKNWQYQHANKSLSKLPPDRLASLPQVLGWQDLWQAHCNEHLAKFERKKCLRLLEREAVNRKFVRTKEVETQTSYSSFRRRLVYIPIYALDYYYNESPYHAAVHGLSTKVIGDRPYGLGALGKSLKSS